ncbi:nitroreductase family protein [Lutispora thermophila]|uniref:Putative nitroreductase TM1586 domain-containing protein n=1 Tax=Lutispora thermophila DSM 19022 TaxID=1122184 RepID=A0A1M6B2L7_9FIRM|nr:nitroreductase family protein [Lutispora thermophila]SHI42907.1 hypothetical protein SAMN02745176_00236 [Lutispora thermophila DSM 19022]
MNFKDFLVNLQSIRDYEDSNVENFILGDIRAYLNEINTAVGREKGFSLFLFENGQEVFNKLEGVGGYSGVMIKSPHYIGLKLYNDNQETEFLGAYFMQSVVKKLFEMELGSCWVNIRNVSHAIKSELLNDEKGNINYILAFGKADEKALKQKSPSLYVQNTSTSPYGYKIIEDKGVDNARLAVSEIVYINEWGNEVSFDELESRGIGDIFFFVRNAPSYKNMQPCRFILRDGEAYLAIVNPENIENYVDAGIMMYTTEGLAKDLGIPAKWCFIGDKDESKEYKIVARIEL